MTTVQLHWEEESVQDGVRVREWSITGAVRPVFGALHGPEHSVAGSPMVCFGHGASGTRHQAPIPHIARRLAREANMLGLSIDGPVHGRRTVGDGARGAFWPEWRRPETVSDMLADWAVAIDVISADPTVDRGSLGYFGLSMGTIYGAPLVAAQPVAAAVLGLMGIAGPTDEYQATVTAAARAIECPVLFIQQLEDELFTREQSLAMFDELGSTNKGLHANPGLHREVPAEEVAAAVAFLVQHLTAAPDA